MADEDEFEKEEEKPTTKRLRANPKVERSKGRLRLAEMRRASQRKSHPGLLALETQMLDIKLQYRFNFAYLLGRHLVGRICAEEANAFESDVAAASKLYDQCENEHWQVKTSAKLTHDYNCRGRAMAQRRASHRFFAHVQYLQLGLRAATLNGGVLFPHRSRNAQLPSVPRDSFIKSSQHGRSVDDSHVVMGSVDWSPNQDQQYPMALDEPMRVDQMMIDVPESPSSTHSSVRGFSTSFSSPDASTITTASSLSSPLREPAADITNMFPQPNFVQQQHSVRKTTSTYDAQLALLERNPVADLRQFGRAMDAISTTTHNDDELRRRSGVATSLSSPSPSPSQSDMPKSQRASIPNAAVSSGSASEGSFTFVNTAPPSQKGRWVQAAAATEFTPNGNSAVQIRPAAASISNSGGGNATSGQTMNFVNTAPPSQSGRWFRSQAAPSPLRQAYAPPKTETSRDKDSDKDPDEDHEEQQGGRRTKTSFR